MVENLQYVLYATAGAKHQKKEADEQVCKESEFEAGDNKEYKMKAFQNNAIYIKETDGHLSRLYHLVAWKNYLEEENI